MRNLNAAGLNAELYEPENPMLMLSIMLWSPASLHCRGNKRPV